MTTNKIRSKLQNKCEKGKEMKVLLNLYGEKRVSANMDEKFLSCLSIVPTSELGGRR